MSASDVALCAEALSKTFARKAYSNFVLDSMLKHSECNIPFCTALYYGVIERKITLDYIISHYSAKPASRIDDKVLQALRCGLHQLLYMDKTSDSAAVNDTVEAVRLLGFTSAKGFANAILRGFIRSGKEFSLPNDQIDALSVEYSVPRPLVEKWRTEYTSDYISLLASTIRSPKPSVRLNTAVFPREEIIARLESENISFSVCDSVPDCLIIQSGNITATKAFSDGCCYVQDVSSQLCAMALDCREDELVLDMCAAPGGKSFTMAQHMRNKGKILAFDLTQKRVGLIEQGARRLGLDCISARVNDATVFSPDIPLADRVLCDCVCSGLGVISKKPEIKYKGLGELEELPAIQLSILGTCSRYVRSGGILVYSTCTVSRAENDRVAEAFLADNPDFDADPIPIPFEPFGGFSATVMPSHFNSDGFYIARFRRK